MRTETTTRTLYTLGELKAKFPDAYAKVHARWMDACATDETPWSEETMDSLKACVKACGATLKDWSIGAYSYSSVKVECDDEYEDDAGEFHAKDHTWLLREVLAPNGYAKDCKPDFPGLCKWTGYCADDSMIEAVHGAMVGGATLSDALESLADVAREEMESNCDQARSEEDMEANWEENEYEENGDDA